MDLPSVRRRASLSASLVVTVLLIGGSMSACAKAPSIPKATYLTRGNEVCKKAAAEWDKKVKELPATDVAKRETYVKRKLVPVLEGVIVQLRTLGYPAGDDDYLESIFGDAIHAIALMKDQPSTDLTKRLDKPFEKPAVRFEAYGLDECGKV